MKTSTKDRIWLVIKLLLLGGLLFVQIRFPDLKEHFGALQRYVSAILFYGTAHLIIDFLRFGINSVYLRRKSLNGKAKDNFVVGVNQIAGLASFVFFVFAGLVALELDVRQVFTSLSIVAAAFAILSKDYISNMINGMIMMFGDQFSIGDQLRIGQHIGRISDITLLNIHLVNDDDDLIYIPNSMVLSVEVINLTKRPVRKVSIDFEIGFEKLGKVEELEANLTDSLSPFKSEISPGSTYLKVVEVKKDAVMLKYQCILVRGHRELEKNIRRTILRKVASMNEGMKEWRNEGMEE